MDWYTRYSNGGCNRELGGFGNRLARTLGGREGERLKGKALDLLAARRESLVRRAQRALLAAVLANGTATADDVRELVELPAGIDPKCFGAAPGALARAGIIESAGFTKTTRPEGHARPLTVWQLTDEAKAIRWLTDHPELPEQDQGAAPAVGPQAMLFDTQETATPTGDAAGAAL
jgi:hypothetical protein